MGRGTCFPALLWTLESTNTFDACIEEALREKDGTLSSYTGENGGQLQVTQRNLFEFSLESNPLSFNYPPTHDIPGSCLPQAVLARKLTVHATWMVSLAKKVFCEGPLPLGQASRI